MPTRHAFGKILAEVRREQGYATPYAFFRSRGGQRGLGLTFANYLSIERGENLPKGWRLKKLIDALGLLPHSARTRELVRAFLSGVLGSEELLDAFVGAAPHDLAPATLSLAERAARQALGATMVQLDLEQYRTLANDPVAYGCHVLLCNTADGLDRAELAKLTGAPATAVAKALNALKAAKLVTVTGARARSALEKNFVLPPTPTPALAGVFAALGKHRAAWTQKGGTLHAPYVLTRARKGEMKRYLDHLSEVVNMAAMFGDTRNAEDSEMYLVEGRVTRIFPKK